MLKARLTVTMLTTVTIGNLARKKDEYVLRLK